MNWPVMPLGEVADCVLGKMLDQQKNRGEMLPYLANVNVRWGDFELQELREMPFEQHERERYGIKYGDIVMCEGGEPGRCAIWKEQRPNMMIQKAIHRIRPHECLDYRFLYYCLLNKGQRGAFAPLFTGSTIKHLPGQNLKKVVVDVPPLSTQKAIADILSAYDDLIENNRRRMALLEESARLLYREWFVHLRFPGHEHVPIKDGVPKGWVRKRLDELAHITMGQSPQSQFYNENGVGLPFHQGVKDFGRRFISHKTWCSVKARLAYPGDILFSVRAPVGRMNLCRDQIVIGRGLSAIRSKSGHQAFLFQQLKSFFFKEDMMGGGAIYAAITKKDLHGVELITPQESLIKAFEDCIIPMDVQIENLHQTNLQLEKARDILLPRLMNGVLTV